MGILAGPMGMSGGAGAGPMPVEGGMPQPGGNEDPLLARLIEMVQAKTGRPPTQQEVQELQAYLQDPQARAQIEQLVMQGAGPQQQGQGMPLQAQGGPGGPDPRLLEQLMRMRSGQ